MGGGKKNKSITKMSKEQAPKQDKKKDKADGVPAAKKSLGLTMPDINNKKVLAELKGLKVLTPSVVATRLNVKLSLANAFLKEMEKRKLAELVSGGKNIKIYKQIQAEA